MKNINKSQQEVSPDAVFSNVTRLSIPLRSTFKYVQHTEYQVFKSVSFADIRTAWVLHISTEMHIPNLLESLPSSKSPF